MGLSMCGSSPSTELWNRLLEGLEPVYPDAHSAVDRPRLERNVFAFKKVIQTCLPTQTTSATLFEAALFKLVVYVGPIVDPDRPGLQRAGYAQWPVYVTRPHTSGESVFAVVGQ